MARVGWREIKERFTHIDARFIECEVGLPKNDGFFTVALYPWWEHPSYLAARDQEGNWGFTNSAGGFREVTVYPKKVYQFQLSRQNEVTDWDFTQEHPILRQYEQSGTVICNSTLSLEQWMGVSERVKDRLTGYNREANVAEYAISQVYRWGHTASFSLGCFPHSLFGVLCQVLNAENIRYFVAFEPKPKKLPVVFLIDGDDYIVADDFEVDVPDFIHKPEWFEPPSHPA